MTPRKSYSKASQYKRLQANVNRPPKGWTVEEDRREEALALSYLVALRRAS